jgi:Fe-S-cluster-containing hydrogenase component 2/bacterioferritin-associated ferredoxin
LRRGPFGLKARVGKAALTGRRAEEEKPIEVPPKPREPVFAKGARVVIECEQNIPCNPCEEICPQGAITVGGEIVNYPQLDKAKCTACGVCLTHCPGLALFVIDADYSDTQAEISLPFEMLPLPKKGAVVDAVDRDGNFVCKATVSRVLSAKSFDRKSIVSIAVEKKYADVVRHFRTDGRAREEAAAPPPAAKFVEGDTVICVCEDISRREIEEVIEKGAESFDEIKRHLRTGMGPCQGKTCQRLIIRMLSEKLGRPVESFEPQTARGPMKPVKLDIIARQNNEEER